MTSTLIKFIQAIVVILALALALSLTACKGKQEEGGGGWAQGPVAVGTARVEQTNANYHITYPGTVVALNQIQLMPQVSGYITGIYFKDGDRVSKGQKLYTIDAQLYAANYDQAVANLRLQETNLLKAQKDADRYHELEKNDAIAKQQVDYAEAALEGAKKQVEAAKAAVQSQQTSVKYTTITAPFDGTIGISQVKVGGAVTAGMTLLNTVSTDNPMAVDFAVDQGDIYRFTKLQQEAKANDSTFTIAFSETDVYPYPGKISFLERAVDAQTGTLKVRLEFPNKGNLLRAGMSCNVRVANNNSAPVILIPTIAITEQLGEYFVYIANGNKATQQKVTLGTVVGNKTIITAGLKGGETIVTDGVQKLHEGSEITTGGGEAAPAANAEPAKAEAKEETKGEAKK
ncbi:MAG: efflux RND transporter periplasmic adaptor subunit [Bacteroidetes bacterium]|nr:efflux RND transporter periplasmic adaptor subunit [Bacteroidota bacterium]